MSSVREIAKQAGVSIATVSRALNNDPGISPKTRAKVLAVANGVGYTATVGRRATTNIAFAYSGEQKLSHPFESAVLEGVAKSLEGSRFNIVLLNLSRALAATAGDTQRVLQLAMQAKEIFGKTPKVHTNELEKVDAWLQKIQANKGRGLSWAKQ